MSDLVRFGLQWSGPKDFICTETADGYWTPWHIAQAQLAAERDKVRVLRVALRKITEANEQSPVKTYQRMEQIAHQALRATATEQEGE